jgi:hypothetical protein
MEIENQDKTPDEHNYVCEIMKVWVLKPWKLESSRLDDTCLRLHHYFVVGIQSTCRN